MNVELWVFVFFIVISLASAIYYLSVAKDSDENYSKYEGPSQDPLGLNRKLRLLNLSIDPIYLCISLLAFSLMGALLCLEYFPGKLFVAIGVALALIGFAYFILTEASLLVVSKFERELIDALDLVQASLHSGQSPSRSFSLASSASSGRVKKELTLLATNIERGLDIENATARISVLYDTESIRLFVNTLIARWRTGADLGALLLPVNKMIRERELTRIKMSGKLSGTRYAAFFMGVIPYVLIPFFIHQDSTWLESITTHPYGMKALGTAIGLQVIGLAWMYSIVKRV